MFTLLDDIGENQKLHIHGHIDNIYGREINEKFFNKNYIFIRNTYT
jgi:hypothetical protein